MGTYLKYVTFLWSNMEELTDHRKKISASFHPVNCSQILGEGKKENQNAAGVLPIISSFLSLTRKCHMETSPEKETHCH